MLKQLSIDSFTLISKAEVPFRNGFTAITGETGAGKSMVYLKDLGEAAMMYDEAWTNAKTR